jgi:hypothetical protein
VLSGVRVGVHVAVHPRCLVVFMLLFIPGVYWCSCCCSSQVFSGACVGVHVAVHPRCLVVLVLLFIPGV